MITFAFEEQILTLVTVGKKDIKMASGTFVRILKNHLLLPTSSFESDNQCRFPVIYSYRVYEDRLNAHVKLLALLDLSAANTQLKNIMTLLSVEV